MTLRTPTRNYPTIFVCAFWIAATLVSATPCLALEAPSNITVVYSEKSIALSWDKVDSAAGYNVYTAPEPGLPLAKRRRINQQIIVSGTHFTFIWEISNGQRQRGVKGYRHFMTVTSVALDNGDTVESAPGTEIDNDYFKGYERVTTKETLGRVFDASQKTPLLQVEQHENSRAAFTAFVTGPLAKLQKLVRDTIDPRQVGACAPLSTVVLKLLSDSGIKGYKAEGTFIKEYHAFVVVNVDGVEYVVDVAADQFVPDVAPVIVPRDLCFLSPDGRLAAQGTPVYQIGRLFAAESSELVDGPEGDLYRWLAVTVREQIAAEKAAAATRPAAKKKTTKKPAVKK